MKSHIPAAVHLTLDKMVANTSRGASTQRRTTRWQNTDDVE